MLLTNPKINESTGSVPTLIANLSKTPTKLTVRGTIPIPPWSSLNPVHSIEWHFQGIAPYNGTGGGPTLGNGCISASSSPGYFAGYSQAQNQDPQVRSVTVPNASYYHDAAFQMLGDVLPVPMESGDSKDPGLVSFWNVGNLKQPERMYEIEMPGKKASAVGITNYRDSSGVDQALMIVYEYDHYEMYIYQAPLSSINTPSPGWELVSTYTGKAFDTKDEYQSFNLVTQTSAGGVDTVYVLGFREDEELWLYTLDTTSWDFTYLEKYTGWKQPPDWRNGMGVQIYDSNTLRIWGTDKDPSGSSKYPNGPASYTFGIYYYA